jgi:hypothetical protein
VRDEPVIATIRGRVASCGARQRPNPGSSARPRSPITIAMIRFLRETWLATAVFVSLSRVNADRETGWVGAFGATLVAAVLVPPIWRWFVMRRGSPLLGRAALAGATVGFLIAISPVFIDAAWYEAHPPPYTDGFGEGLGGFLLLFVLFAFGFVGGALGTGVGMVVALLQRHWPHQREQAGEPDSGLDGAIGGALVATLASPIVIVLGGIVLPKSILPTQRHGGVSLGILFFEGWFVLIALGALLGWKGVERWRRLPPPVGDSAAVPRRGVDDPSMDRPAETGRERRCGRPS